MRNLHILIADDSPTFCATLSATLKDNGYDVSVVLSGEEAIQAFETNPPDLLLIDLNMPGIGGIEAIKKIRKIETRHWVPIIVITASSDDEALLDSFLAGADDFLTKPINPIHFEIRLQSMTRISAMQHRHYAVMDSVIDGIIKIDPVGRVTEMNKAAEQLFGYAKTEVIGKNVNMLMPEPFKSQHDEYISNYMATREPKVIGKGREVVGRKKNGDTFPMSLGVTESTAMGQRFFVGVVRDLTQEKAMQSKLASERAFLTNLIENSDALIYAKDCDGQYILVNKRYEEVTGLLRENVVGLNDRDLFSPSQAQAYRDIDLQVQNSGQIFKGEEQLAKEDQEIFFLTTKFPIYSPSGEPQGICGISTEITPLKQAQAALAKLSELDDLSGLFNRRHFMSLAQHELARADRNKMDVAVLMLDIDKFKEVNDTYGHPIGDKVIRELGRLLSSLQKRQTDVTGRIGGEEFAVLLPDTSLKQALVHAEKLRVATSKILIQIHDSLQLNMSVSVGVSALSGRKISFDKLLTEADHALYEAKRTGRNKVIAFGLLPQ